MSASVSLLLSFLNAPNASYTPGNANSKPILITAEIQKAASTALICRILMTWAQGGHLRSYEEVPLLFTSPSKHPKAIMAGHKSTPVTPQQVGAIKVMAGNKKSKRDIANSFGMKKRTVAYEASTARRSGGPAQEETRGRPKLLSQRELRGLRRVVQDNPFASMAEIAETVTTERAKTVWGPASRLVSFKTLRRAVKGLGLTSCAPAKKPFVSDVNKEKRLKWGTQHESRTYHWAFAFLSD